MSNGILFAIAVTIGVPLLLIAYIVLSEKVIGRLPSNVANKLLRPLIWLLPGGVLMALVLAYPVISTLRLSLFDAKGKHFVGFANYAWALTNRQELGAITRTVIWMVAVPTVVVLVGVLFSVLADRVRYERVARLCITIPCAVSMTAGSIIWSLMYRYDPPGLAQTGFVNKVYTSLTGNESVPWLLNGLTNNAALMLIGLWAWLGFAGLLLSAAIKAVPAELLDAARLDGANEWQIFRHITLRQITPMLTVVFAMITAWALKVFDIVYVLTNGQYGTSVLGTSVYTQLFTLQHQGRGSALAVVILLFAIPVVAANVWRIRNEEKV
jgi:alpha-glucoside transport system permease protein